MKTEKQKMLAGELYNGSDPELEADRTRTAAILRAYNFSTAVSPAAEAAFKALFAHFGDNSIIRAPFFCDYGSNISIGHRVFLNFNCIILDVAAVTIGDDARIGPGVQIYAADHPRDHALRLQDLESAKPVAIGRNVWIGPDCIIAGSLTVGDGATVLPDTFLTFSVAPRAVVKGNPAVVMRKDFDNSPLRRSLIVVQDVATDNS